MSNKYTDSFINNIINNLGGYEAVKKIVSVESWRGQVYSMITGSYYIVSNNYVLEEDELFISDLKQILYQYCVKNRIFEIGHCVVDALQPWRGVAKVVSVEGDSLRLERWSNSNQIKGYSCGVVSKTDYRLATEEEIYSARSFLENYWRN